MTNTSFRRDAIRVRATVRAMRLADVGIVIPHRKIAGFAGANVRFAAESVNAILLANWFAIGGIVVSRTIAGIARALHRTLAVSVDADLLADGFTGVRVVFRRPVTRVAGAEIRRAAIRVRAALMANGFANRVVREDHRYVLDGLVLPRESVSVEAGARVRRRAGPVRFAGNLAHRDTDMLRRFIPR